MGGCDDDGDNGASATAEDGTGAGSVSGAYMVGHQ